ncbi:hypothetical protein HGB13_04785, partial [bacterium]|nr:hypothetical protein [bacterium]
MSKHLDIRYTILQTIIWFDLFDKAVTLNELCNFIFKEKKEKKDILRALRKMVGKQLGRKGDVYFIKGREHLIDIRKERLKISEIKYKNVKKYLRILKALPFVRGIAITQNLAIDNAKKTSDVDLLIITSKNKIFIARFCVNIFLDI